MLRWLTVMLAVVAVATLWSDPAWGTTVTVDPATLPATAQPSDASQADPGLLRCGIAPADTVDRDIWVFQLTEPLAPSPTPTTPDPEPTLSPAPSLLSLTAVFAPPGDAEPVTISLPGQASDGAIVDQTAWLDTPRGWSLTEASAEISGDAGRLELVRVCPAAPAAEGILAAPTPTARATATPIPEPEMLPVAGTDVTGIVSVGTGLILTGILLVLFHGRKPRVARDRDEDDDIRRPVIMTRS